MQTVLDLPVVTPMRKQGLRIGQFAGKTGDGVLDFDRDVTFAGGRAFETENLGQAGPIKMFG